MTAEVSIEDLWKRPGVTCEQAARLLDRHPNRVRALVSAGVIPISTFTGRTRLIPTSKLRALIESGEDLTKAAS